MFEEKNNVHMFMVSVHWNLGFENHYYAIPVYSWSIKIPSYERYQSRRIYIFLSSLNWVQNGFSSYYSGLTTIFSVTCHFFPKKASKVSFHWPGSAHLQLPFKGIVQKKTSRLTRKVTLPLTCFLLELSSIHCRQWRVSLMINTFSIFFFSNKLCVWQVKRN